MGTAAAASLTGGLAVLSRLGDAGASGADSLDRPGGFVEIAAPDLHWSHFLAENRYPLFREMLQGHERMEKPVDKPARRRIVWVNVMTVLSAAILIGAEVFGAAFAGGWAIAGLLDLGQIGSYALRGLLFVLGLVVMAAFIRNAQRVEPFKRG
jgi:hypothetical protein